MKDNCRLVPPPPPFPLSSLSLLHTLSPSQSLEQFSCAFAFSFVLFVLFPRSKSHSFLCFCRSIDPNKTKYNRSPREDDVKECLREATMNNSLRRRSNRHWVGNRSAIGTMAFIQWVNKWNGAFRRVPFGGFAKDHRSSSARQTWQRPTATEGGRIRRFVGLEEASEVRGGGDKKSDQSLVGLADRVGLGGRRCLRRACAENIEFPPFPPKLSPPAKPIAGSGRQFAKRKKRRGEIRSVICCYPYPQKKILRISLIERIRNGGH